MKMLPLVILIVVTPVTHSFSGHSLQYYHMMVSVPGPGLPEYISVGYVDRIQITHYSSDTGQARPVAPWMERLDLKYWKEETENNKQAKNVHEQNMKISMNRCNQSEGFHIFQEMYGCETRNDGSTRGYWMFGYDGKDLIALDTGKRIFKSLTDSVHAQRSAQSWNRQNVLEIAKYYLETECIDWLRKYLEYGKEELERRVRPEVKVSSHRSGSAMKLHCQVFGFHPRDVDVNWKKNEEIEILSDEAKQILPNSNGTYQLRVSVEVTLEEGASYSCHVDHSSLEEPLIVTWDPQSHGVYEGMTTGHIFGSVIFAAVFVFVCCFIMLFCSDPLKDEHLQRKLGHVGPASDNDFDQLNRIEVIVEANDPEPQG